MSGVDDRVKEFLASRTWETMDDGRQTQDDHPVYCACGVELKDGEFVVIDRMFLCLACYERAYNAQD
jgi:hypothetical protein